MQIKSAANFETAIAQANHGDVIIYHVGFLVEDRRRFAIIKQIGNAAWRAYVRGEGHLTQRRLGPCRYEYAFVRRLPAKPVTFIGCYGPDWEYHKPVRVALAA